MPDFTRRVKQPGRRGPYRKARSQGLSQGVYAQNRSSPRRKRKWRASEVQSPRRKAPAERFSPSRRQASVLCNGVCASRPRVSALCPAYAQQQSHLVDLVTACMRPRWEARQWRARSEFPSKIAPRVQSLPGCVTRPPHTDRCRFRGKKECAGKSAEIWPPCHVHCSMRIAGVMCMRRQAVRCALRLRKLSQSIPASLSSESTL